MFRLQASFTAADDCEHGLPCELPITNRRAGDDVRPDLNLRGVLAEEHRGDWGDRVRRRQGDGHRSRSEALTTGCRVLRSVIARRRPCAPCRQEARRHQDATPSRPPRRRPRHRAPPTARPRRISTAASAIPPPHADASKLSATRKIRRCAGTWNGLAVTDHRFVREGQHAAFEIDHGLGRHHGDRAPVGLHRQLRRKLCAEDDSEWIFSFPVVDPVEGAGTPVWPRRALHSGRDERQATALSVLRDCRGASFRLGLRDRPSVHEGPCLVHSTTHPGFDTHQPFRR